MRELPWYLRKAPAIFCGVAVIDFLKNFFEAVGYRSWSQANHSPADFVGGFDLLMLVRFLDAVVYAFGWVATAMTAMLLLAIFDKVSAH